LRGAPVEMRLGITGFCGFLPVRFRILKMDKRMMALRAAQANLAPSTNLHVGSREGLLFEGSQTREGPVVATS
jgi:hypothetical protein